MSARLLIALVFVALPACGARSALDVEPPDAAAPAPWDAGFVTFPCRWSLGISAPIQSGDFVGLTGAVHPTLATAAVVAWDQETSEMHGAQVSIAASGGVEASLHRAASGRAFSLFTGEEGFLEQFDGFCGVAALDLALLPTEGFVEWAESPERCTVTQSVIGRLESASSSGALISVRPYPEWPLEPRGLGRTMPADDGETFTVYREAEDTTWIAIRRDGQLEYERHDGGRPEVYLREGARAFSAAADNLRGGMVILVQDAAGAWQLERFGLEPGRGPELLAELGAMEPAGPVATNQTEALVPLADGRLAYFSLASARPMFRFTDPVEASPVARARVILRPDDSAGGLLYQGGRALRFQPLICNR